jgi:hypothetical protein
MDCVKVVLGVIAISAQKNYRQRESRASDLPGPGGLPDEVQHASGDRQGNRRPQKKAQGPREPRERHKVGVMPGSTRLKPLFGDPIDLPWSSFGQVETTKRREAWRSTVGQIATVDTDGERWRPRRRFSRKSHPGGRRFESG